MPDQPPEISDIAKVEEVTGNLLFIFMQIFTDDAMINQRLFEGFQVACLSCCPRRQNGRNIVFQPFAIGNQESLDGDWGGAVAVPMKGKADREKAGICPFATLPARAQFRGKGGDDRDRTIQTPTQYSWCGSRGHRAFAIRGCRECNSRYASRVCRMCRYAQGDNRRREPR